MDYLIKDTTLSAIASKIREKTGTSGTRPPENMPQGVDDAYDKGYQQGKEDHQPLGEVDIDSNGQHWVGAYEYAKVNVPIPDGYIKPTGTLNINENGERDVTQYAKVNVNIATVPPWSQTRSDIAVGTRSVWAISASGGLPSLSPSNTEAAIGVTTPNNYGYTDRESETVYVMPVPARANSVTLNSTDGQPCTHHFIGLKESGGKFSIVFDTGKQASNSHTFTAGSITHMLISMERTNGTVFPWGYNDSQITVVFTGEGTALDEWWDKMQSNGSRTNYKGSFGGWSGDLFYPTHNIKPTGDCQYFLMCWIADGEAIDLDARLIECGITMDFSGVTNLSYFLRENEAIGKLPALNLSGCTAYNYMFYAAKKLVTIGEITANINAAWGEYSFRQCTSLEHITFAPGTIGKSIKFQHSTKLTPESIESIIYGLSDDVTGQTCSINSTAVYNYQSAYGGSTWISLVQSKPNWTITTV